MEQIFKYNNAQVRMVMNETGEPWFVAVDVCDILEYQNPQNIIKTLLDEDERRLTDITDRSGQKRRVWAISEAGLFSLVLTSTKPEAKPFKRWITHDVIPSIRKAGFYATDKVTFKLSELQDFRKRIAEKNSELEKAREAVKRAKQEVDELDKQFWKIFNTDPNQLKLFSHQEMEAVKKREVTNG